MATLTREDTVQAIPPDRIQQNPENPRIFFRPEEMNSLLRSIDRYGVKVPISVYKEGNRFVLIDGERRWRCSKKLNLKTIPALIEKRPTALENLLLMYNIHALREQWDYFTLASGLRRVIELHKEKYGYDPNEVELSESTGLTRGQIRRCRLLLNLPPRYSDLLLEELELPKNKQKLSEDFFIEMERALRTVTKRMPAFNSQIDEIRDTLINKFREGSIKNVTDFRQMSKIATAVDKFAVAEPTARSALLKIFEPDTTIGIQDVYEKTFGVRYAEHQALRHVEYLTTYCDDLIERGRAGKLDEEFLQQLQRLRQILEQVLGS